MSKLWDGSERRFESASPQQLARDFWTLWLRERAMFHKMCRKWLNGNDVEAEDALSRGALNAIEFILGGSSPPRVIRPWVVRILYNVCVDTLRARARQQILVGDEVPDSVPDSAVSALPERAILQSELRVSLADALGALPAHLRPVFVLRFMEQLPYDEISRLLTISPQNARKRAQLVRGLLRDRLESFV